MVLQRGGGRAAELTNARVVIKLGKNMMRHLRACLWVTLCVALFAIWAWGAAARLHAQAAGSVVTFAADDYRLLWLGRYDDRDAKHPRLGYPGTGVTFRFRGTSALVDVASDSEKSALTVVVDHGAPALLTLAKGANRVGLASGLEDGPHTVEVFKRTETWQGVLTFSGVDVATGGELLRPPLLPGRKLMFIGDSVTCGAGVDNNAQCKDDPARPANDAYHAYGMVLARRLDTQFALVCYGGRGVTRDYRGLGIDQGVPNAPQFLDMAIATDDPAGRVGWDAARWTPDGIVISLGTNDFNLQKSAPLDGLAWVSAYAAMVRRVRAEYPAAEIWLTEGAIVTDPLLRQYVQQTVAEVKDAKVHYVAARHYPGNGCNAHPTTEQHGRIADDLEPVLRRGLGW